MELYEDSEKSELFGDNLFDRIKIQNVIIIERIYDGIQFHYGFHGNSYVVQNKLELYIQTIRALNDIWGEIIDENLEKISIISKSLIIDHANEIFFN